MSYVIGTKPVCFLNNKSDLLVGNGPVVFNNAAILALNRAYENPGIFSVAASFDGNVSNHLTTASHADFQGTHSFTIAGWMNTPILGQLQILFSKEGVTGDEYDLFLNSNNRFYLSSFDNIGGRANVFSDTITSNVWVFIVAWFDVVAETINISLNNGTVQTVDTSAVLPVATDQEIQIGITDGNYPQRGKVDSLGFWKRVLTSQEIKYLYNRGGGKFYSELTAGIKTNLISWWDMNQTTGNRLDSHGTHHFVVHGTVGSGTGIR